MRTLRTVVLRHETRAGSHYDWLVEDASASPRAPLWTARAAFPPSQWRALGTLLLTPLPPHRRRYLTYQGAISGGRGAVRRVEAGEVNARLWTASRLVLDVRMPGFEGGIEARAVSDRAWRCAVL